MTNSGRRLSNAVSGVLIAALLATACARSDTTPVARGEYFAAGQPDYDEFFVTLYRFQLETAAVLKDEQAARTELSRGLGAKSDKQNELVRLVQQRAGELDRQGVRVVLTPGKPPAVEVSGEPAEEQKKFIEALRSSSAKLGNVETASADSAGVDRLRTKVTELERRTDSAFQAEGAGKRGEVKDNLRDAQKLLVIISDTRKGLAKSSAELLRELERTFAPPPPPPEVAEEPKPKPKSKRRAVRRSSPPAAKSPAAPAAPKPAPAPAAPAPKPATPKADFEP